MDSLRALPISVLSLMSGDIMSNNDHEVDELAELIGALFLVAIVLVALIPFFV